MTGATATCFDGSYFHNGEIVPAKGFCTDVFFEQAIAFISRCAKQQKPFLAYISTNAPHKPLHCPPKYLEMYDGQSDNIAAFYGMITNIDDNVGRTRQLIAELGVADDTIFIFTTDNGTASGAKVFNAGMRAGKGSPYEGGHRVPFFVHWPGGGLTNQHDVNELTHAVDVVPTLLAMTGVKKPDGVKFDGVSIADLLDPTKDVDWPRRFVISDSQRVRDPIKWRGSSVMTDKYRLVNRKELYDIASDPGQKNNIADQHPDIVADMREFYEQWWAELKPTFAQTTEIHLGHPEHPVVRLTAHDWIQEIYPPWHQGSIREADRKPSKGEKLRHLGYWAVKVIQNEKYRVSLRRWPAESGVAINAALPAGENVPGASRAFRNVTGNAIAATFRGTSSAGLFGDHVQELDSHVGTLLRTLDELGLTEITLVIFTSDNGSTPKDFKGTNGVRLNLADDSGDVRRKFKTAKEDAKKLGHVTNGPWHDGKGYAYEGGHRVPFIARWPG